MSIIRQVAQLGNEVLRLKAAEVKKITSPSIQSLIDDMLSTVSDSGGVGIAAPQVYESLQIFIIASRPTPRYPLAPKMEPTAIINPEILGFSEEQDKDWEGCLSIPGIRGLVPRYKSVRAKYLTRDGTIEDQTFSDFLARIFQHEYDHLNGISFLDRLESAKDIITEKEFNKL
ncbi:MAG: peptide deformylase [Pseudomonadota bacterium]